MLSRAELGRLGFHVVLYANAALRAAQAGVTRVLRELVESATTARSLTRSLHERQNTVGKPHFDELEQRHAKVAYEEMDAYYDLRLSGGTVVLPGVGARRADVIIRNGIIAGIVEPTVAAKAGQTLDCSGYYVLPGVIDAHVHLGSNITYPTSEDEVLPETQAAAAGGVTTILAYLMSPEPYEDVFADARGAMEEHSAVDFGFHFCVVTSEQLANVPHYVTGLGVSSFKFFMNFRDDEGAYLGLPGNDDGFLFDLLLAAAASGAMVNPHAENIELVWRLSRLGVEPGTSDLETWCQMRPDYVEAEALGRVGFLAEVAGASVYAVHTTSRAALEVLDQVRSRYENVYVETCPHYLTLDVGSLCGVYGKVNPPLRTEADRAALWDALAGGRVDVVGSDHVPRHRSFKEKNIVTASAGFPGLQTLLPLLLSEGHVKRGLPLERVVDVVATRPARLFGLYPRKGAIQVGADADLVVVDLGSGDHIEASQQLSAAEYTPWEGWTLDCRVLHTLLRGRFVYRDREPVDRAAGTYLPRPASGATALGGVR